MNKRVDEVSGFLFCNLLATIKDERNSHVSSSVQTPGWPLISPIAAVRAHRAQHQAEQKLFEYEMPSYHYVWAVIVWKAWWWIFVLRISLLFLVIFLQHTAEQRIYAEWTCNNRLEKTARQWALMNSEILSCVYRHTQRTSSNISCFSNMYSPLRLRLLL